MAFSAKWTSRTRYNVKLKRKKSCLRQCSRDVLTNTTARTGMSRAAAWTLAMMTEVLYGGWKSDKIQNETRMHATVATPRHTISQSYFILPLDTNVLTNSYFFQSCFCRVLYILSRLLVSCWARVALTNSNDCNQEQSQTANLRHGRWSFKIKFLVQLPLYRSDKTWKTIYVHIRLFEKLPKDII